MGVFSRGSHYFLSIIQGIAQASPLFHHPLDSLVVDYRIASIGGFGQSVFAEENLSVLPLASKIGCQKLNMTKFQPLKQNI